MDFTFASTIFGYIAKNLTVVQVDSIFTIDVLAFCLAIAAAAKSAQFFFHTWLVDAMEGPTPVSALLHSATMVTAGVYLIVRCSYIFNLSVWGSLTLLLLGSFTTVFAGVVACFQ